MSGAPAGAPLNVRGGQGAPRRTGDLRERSITVSAITRATTNPRFSMPQGTLAARVSMPQATLAALSMAAAAIHFAVMGEHFAEYVAYGVFFSVVAWLQASWAVGVIALPSRSVLLAGLLGNALVVVVWVLSRTTGLPIGPEAGAPEPAAFVDVLSTIIELAIGAGAALLMLRGRPTAGSTRHRPGSLTLAALVVVLAVLTTWSVAIAATSGGEHGTDHGVAEEAATMAGSDHP